MSDLRKRLARAVVDERASDYVPLDHDEKYLVEDNDTLKDAAVLIAVTDRPEPGLLFVQRPDYMRAHAGQIAFPGGKLDPEDGNDPVTGALREAQEELAIPPDAVEIVGVTDRYHSWSGFNIRPVIGIVPPDLKLEPCDEEVADWFEAPLDWVIADRWATRHERLWEGNIRHYYEIHWQNRMIWGITAGIIQNLRQRLIEGTS